MIEVIAVPVVRATRQNIAEYGILIGTDVPRSGLAIPFYKGSVEEGYNLPFEYTGKAVVRTARIHPRPGDVTWLERHLRLTQLFIGLGDAPLGLVLGKPTHHSSTPNLSDVVAFVLPPGHGVILHAGTWHDFPMALDRPVTVLTANSSEVIDALISQKTMDEMDRGDVFKIDVKKRLGKALRVNFDNDPRVQPGDTEPRRRRRPAEAPRPGDGPARGSSLYHRQDRRERRA